MNQSSEHLPKKNGEVGFLDYFLFLFFLLFWLVPVWYSGLTQKRLSIFPRSITYFQNIGNLFTLAVPVWPMPYVQIELEGQKEWTTLSEGDFFSLTTFGHRTRLFEALYLATNIPDYERKSTGVQKELAHWVAKKYVETHPDAKVKQVRFVAGLFFVSKDSSPEGKWDVLPFESYQKENTYVISTHQVQ